MGCGLCLRSLPLIAGRGRGLVSCGYGSGLVPGHPWALSDVGPGPFVSSLVRTCGPDDYYASSCPPSLVFSLLMGNSTRLVRCFPCLSRASTDDIRAALLLVGGLEPCALFLATYFVTDVTLCQAVRRLATLRLYAVCLVISLLWAPSVGFTVIPSITIDASVCPIFVPWYNNVSVKKDPLPSDDIVDFKPLKKLDNNRTMITKYGVLSRFVKFNAIFWSKNKRKVGASAGPPPIKKARTGGANVDSEAVSSLAEEFVSSSITPTPKRDYEDESVSNHDDNHVCMVSELRMRYEHEIMIREKFEKKFTNSSEVIQQRDAEVVELTSKLERAEGEAADVVELRRRVSGLEFVRDGLKGNAVKLEFECERLRSQVERAVCGNVGCRDIIYETEKNKSLVSATPLSIAFISTSIVQDFQDSPDDEEDTRSSHEYLNDLEEEYQARALLAKSKRFFKKGTQRFSSAKATDQTKCHKCGKKGHFARDCWSKASVPSYQSPFQPKPLSSSQHKPKLRLTKDFKAKYNKVKAKLALLSSSASASKAATIKNKGLITEAYEWDEEEVSSDDNEMVDVKVLMALAEENDVVSKEVARNGEWVKISIRKVHTLLEMEDNDDRKYIDVSLCGVKL
ncbi:retrovirus-related pol polyprotein from transposon TNT 1-94 [Tanacetum coccineum]